MPLRILQDWEAKRAFLRTPKPLGYATITYTPTKKLSGKPPNIVYTGLWKLPIISGEGTGQQVK